MLGKDRARYNAGGVVACCSCDIGLKIGTESLADLFNTVCYGMEAILRLRTIVLHERQACGDTGWLGDC